MGEWWGMVIFGMTVRQGLCWLGEMGDFGGGDMVSSRGGGGMFFILGEEGGGW